jgi:flagellar hook-basal body complex protein FliE
MYVAPITSGSVITPLSSLFDEGVKAVDNITESDSENQLSFSSTLAKAIGEINEMENQSNQYSYEIAMGNTENLEEMLIHNTQLNTAVQLATTITSRVVSTYKEIMSMQI